MLSMRAIVSGTKVFPPGAVLGLGTYGGSFKCLLLLALVSYMVVFQSPLKVSFVWFVVESNNRY
jgi:hypothetical protein